VPLALLIVVFAQLAKVFAETVCVKPAHSKLLATAHKIVVHVVWMACVEVMKHQPTAQLTALAH